jgi:tRNA threonylcarbamoyl adenosine modification protein (Sua5/YciO/YrdC/YwlC family)
MRNISDLVTRAVHSLKKGGVVLYPTDTLMGLGADATQGAAVSRLFQIKDRPQGMAVSVLFSSVEEIEPYVHLSSQARAVIRHLLPGPYTVLLRSSTRARNQLANGLVSPRGVLGVRVSDHPVAQELARRAGPITTTSANVHGSPPVRSLLEARRAFGNQVSVYLAPSPPPSGVPSTLVDLTGVRPIRTPRHN